MLLLDNTTQQVGMSSENVSALGTAFTTATGNMVDSLVSFAPALLGIAVAGFCVAMVFKAIKKVKKGGK